MRCFPRPAAFLIVLVAINWSATFARAGESFTLVSYNVENWLDKNRANGGQNLPTESKPESEKNAVIAIIAAHKPAVVGVMEMGSREEFADFRRRLADAGLVYPHAEWHEGIDPERHVALLSRYPIVAHDSQDHVPLDLDGKPNGIQRGILDVTIEPEKDHPLRLIGLHLKSRRKVPDFDETTLRAKEALAVREYVDAILKKDPGIRLLVFGDLNETKDQYPIRELLGPRNSPLSLTDIPVADSRGERWTHHFAEADEYARIDFFLASPSLTSRIDKARSGIDDSPLWSEASDHRAIFLKVNATEK